MPKNRITCISKRARSLPKRFLKHALCLTTTEDESDKPKDAEAIEKTNPDSAQVCIYDKKIFENILSFLDIATLRELRFVNKAWNIEVCRFLRKTIVITIIVGAASDSRSKDFGKFLFTTKQSSNLLPFRFLRLNISEWEDETLDQILDDERILPREICVKQDTASFGCEARLLKILSLKAASIQKLGLNVGLPSFPFENINLPALSVLFMTDVNEREQYSNFTIRLINIAPNLKILWLFGQDPNFVCRILENSNLQGIEELGDLCMQSILSKTFSLDSCGNLRKLVAIEYPEQSPFRNVPLTLVRSFAKLVEELHISWDPSPSSEKIFPYCPKLQSIFIRKWGGSIGAFTPKALPQLKEIIFFDEIIGSDDDQITDPHFGVDSFVMESYRREPERLFPPPIFSRFLKHVSVQFPNLTSLELFWRIRHEYSQLIVKNFSKLEKLFLYAVQGYSEITFTGIEEDDLQLQLLEGKDLNEVERLPCLMHLTELKQLTLLEGFVHFPTLTKHGLLYGISKIPKLEQLTIHYHSKLEPSVKKSFGKLKRFNILTREQITEYKVGRQQQRLCSFMKKST